MSYDTTVAEMARQMTDDHLRQQIALGHVIASTAHPMGRANVERTNAILEAERERRKAPTPAAAAVRTSGEGE